MKLLFIFIASYMFVSVSTEYKCLSPNERYICGGTCDNVCLTLRVMNQTHCPITNNECIDKCYCNEGYARDANNVCVPFEDCQNSTVRSDRWGWGTSEVPSCGPNEEYKSCICRPDTCLSLVRDYWCGLCISGCACRDGYLRRTRRAPCRPMQECPQANSTDIN